MIREKYSIIKDELKLNIMDGTIDSIRKKSIQGTAFKTYKDGKVSIATAMGDVDDDQLAAQSEEELAFGSHVDWQPTEKLTASRSTKIANVQAEDFVAQWEECLAHLKETHADYILTNNIVLNGSQVTLTNDLGTELTQKAQSALAILILQNRQATTDDFSFVINQDIEVDKETLYQAVSENVQLNKNKVDLPGDGQYPVISMFSLTQNFFDKHLGGEVVGNQSSYFKNDLGKKIFNEKMTLRIVTDQSEGRSFGAFSPQAPMFFDAEGTIRENTLIFDKGVFVNPLSSRKSAEKYGFLANGGTSAPYSQLPKEGCEYTLDQTHDHLDEILQGRTAILEVVSPGGDFTSDGDFATPCILSYLYQDGKLVGQLPALQLSGHIRQMFGDDYLGTCPLPMKGTDGMISPVVMMDVKVLK